MSPEAEQQPFRRLIVDEASKDRTLLQPLARSAPVALQATSLARVQFGRAKRELPGAIGASDFDEPYLNFYRSLVSGCNAMLAAYGYRVRGGDGSHFETLRLAAWVWRPRARRLERSWRPSASQFAALAMRPNISAPVLQPRQTFVKSSMRCL